MTPDVVMLNITKQASNFTLKDWQLIIAPEFCFHYICKNWKQKALISFIVVISFYLHYESPQYPPPPN